VEARVNSKKVETHVEGFLKYLKVDYRGYPSISAVASSHSERSLLIGIEISPYK